MYFNGVMQWTSITMHTHAHIRDGCNMIHKRTYKRRHNVEGDINKQGHVYALVKHLERRTFSATIPLLFVHISLRRRALTCPSEKPKAYYVDELHILAKHVR